jgi:chemotaxis protein CheX
MKMELIQPFINAADAVLAEMLQSPTQIGDVDMDVNAYRRHGMAAIISIQGDIEGRVIFDLDSATALKIATYLSGGPVDASDDMIRETVFELANQVIGNAVTSLNDQGFHFRISPPELHSADEGIKTTVDTEALVLCFNTANGDVYMNVAMHYNRRRSRERAAVAG